MRTEFNELLGEDLYGSEDYKNCEIDLIRLVFNETEKHPVRNVLHHARIDKLSSADVKNLLKMDTIDE